jgi:hypothetical protein
MKGYKVQAFILVISVLFIVGCSSLQNMFRQDKTDELNQPIDIVEDGWEMSGDFGDIQIGEEAQWPDYIPAEIPVLPGEIETVMVAPESHIRLFYSKISDKDIENYLDILEKEGFNLEFRIYVQEGFPDNSEEKRKRGEYDAVDITKGDFRMNLSHGDGRATYDIYTTGFQDVVEESVALTWPLDLEGILPPPERCELVTISPNNKEGYHITCKREDEAADQDYLTLLESRGFQVFETIKDDSGNSVVEKLRSGDIVVFMTPNFGSHITLDVYIEPIPEWPVVFDSVIPRPEGCELTAIIPSVLDGAHIQCKPENDKVLQEYVYVLEALGFEELHRFANPDGEIMIIGLSNGETTVDLSSDSPEFMSVGVSQNSP